MLFPLPVSTSLSCLESSFFYTFFFLKFCFKFCLYFNAIGFVWFKDLKGEELYFGEKLSLPDENAVEEKKSSVTWKII